MRKASGMLVIVVAAVAIAAVGCENNAQTGALGGAAVGALAGQAIGHNTAGTLIGGAVGAGGGYMVGNEMDKKKMSQDAEYSRQMSSTYVVNVHNSNGSITPVTLARQGNMWVGPQGEQYANLPSEDQLRPMYGR